MPWFSPGRSTPVGFENPNRRTQRSKRVAPSFRPIITVPTLDERARMSAVVSLADLAVGDLDRRRHLERRVGLDQALLERAGHRERLEGRAGLVVELDCPVLAPGSGGGRHVF